MPAIVAAYQVTEAIKILLGSADVRAGLLMLDVWANSFQIVDVKPRDGCPACSAQYEFLKAEFGIHASSLCGQSRSVQVVNTRLGEVDLRKLASGLKGSGNIRRQEYLLQFEKDKHDISVFPDGRVIIKNTVDESTALEFYNRELLPLLQLQRKTAGIKL